MSKKNTKLWQVAEYNWQGQLGLSVGFIVVSYIFVSLAIDSGNLLEWALGVFFLCWGLVSLSRALRQVKK